MPSLATFLSWLSGAGPVAMLIGFFLWRALKKIDLLEAKVEAQQTALLDAHKQLIPIVLNSSAALNGSAEVLETLDIETLNRTPTGRHRSPR